MKIETLREFIYRLWDNTSNDSFIDESILNLLLKDGGYDTKELSLEMITLVLNENSPKDWNIVRFAFSEVLCYYLVSVHKLSKEQIIVGLFVSCVLADIARANETTWDLEHNKVLSFIQLVSERLALNDVLFVLCYIFGKNGHPPIYFDVSSMVSGNLRRLIECIWKRGFNNKFSDDILYSYLLQDSKTYLGGLTVQDVTNLLNEKYSKNWQVVAFEFSEMIYLYLVIGHKMSFYQAIAALFSICVLADASRANEHYWSQEHDMVMALNAILSSMIEFDDVIYFMNYVFGKGGKPPINNNIFKIE